jgi:hypothetical protein
MNVYSKIQPLCADGSEEYLEFWRFNHSPVNDPNVLDASFSVYDFGDYSLGGVDYGSKQVHAASLQTTVFAFNRWNSNFVADIGIGNNPSTIASQHPDSTFASNGDLYTRLLRCG